MPVAESLNLITGCPACGAEFTGWSYDHEPQEPVEYDGSVLSPILAGRTVIDYPMQELLAWVLEPCGCRISPDEWQMCQTAHSRWFALPGEVESTILAVMAQEAKRDG